MKKRKTKPAIKWPKLTGPQWRVLLCAMEWHEAEEVLERGFKGATCSGPQSFWMAERIKAKEALKTACEDLKRAEKDWLPWHERVTR